MAGGRFWPAPLCPRQLTNVADSWSGRLAMGSGAFQPEVTASNTAPVGSDGKSLRPSRCLIACAKWAGGGSGQLWRAGGHGANQRPCRQTPLTPLAKWARTAAGHHSEPTPRTSNGVSAGINKILSVEGTVQFSYLFFHPTKRCHLAALLFGGISCARGPQGFAQVSTRKPAPSNAGAGCCGDQDGF